MSSDVPAQARPLILDPRVVPVVGTDDHLLPVPLERLTPEAVRQRLAFAHRASPALSGDAARVADSGGRPPTAASVLVPLVWRAGVPQVLLTRRTDHLRDHAGQISFPGGRAEPDDEDAVATALREAEEEVGLARPQVDVIGTMANYTTITGFIVTPVVGRVAPDYALTLDPFEVAEAFEVPLPFLMNPAHHRRHEFEAAGQRRQFLSMPWTRDPSRPDEYFIWGATAAMLRNLYHLLRD